MEFSQDFVKDFFNRTKYNLELYELGNKMCKERFQYETTQLINSLLGLVVFIKEDKLDAIQSNKYDDFQKAIRIEKEKWEYKHRKKAKGEWIEEDRNFQNFIRHLRNAISHAKIKCAKEPEATDITHIRFEDECNSPKCEGKFEVVLSLAQIKELIDMLEQII